MQHASHWLSRMRPTFPLAVALALLVMTAAAAAAEPTISLIDPPATYRTGSGEGLRFETTGDLGEAAEVVAIARNGDRRAVVERFGHAVPASAGHITAGQLDLLPAGSNRVELLLRDGGRELARTQTHLSVLGSSATPATLSTFDIGFGPDLPASYDAGSGKGLPLTVTGDLPRGYDVLVVAWSDGGSRMVDAFTHTRRGGPWRIDADRLSRLPEGYVTLQLQVRHRYNTLRKVSHTLRITRSGPVTPAPAPADREHDGKPAQTDASANKQNDTEPPLVETANETLTPAEVEKVAKPAKPEASPAVAEKKDPPATDPGDAPETADAAAINVAFASYSATVHTVGEDTNITITVDRALPEGAAVQVLGWSEVTKSYVPGFAHTHHGSARVDVACLDLLPEGRAQVQAVLKVPGREDRKAVHVITVLDPDRIDKSDEPDGTEPDRPEEPTVADNNDAPEEAPVADTPVTSEGWTQFTRSPDTRVIHVSSSAGDDANDGLSPERPIKTLREGYTRMRSGYPDWLLLKAGDTWNHDKLGDQDGRWTKSGRSKSEKMLISSYGDGARPVIKNRGFGVFWGYALPERVDHLALVDLEFYNAERDPNSSEYGGDEAGRRNGFGFILAGRDLLIEGCKFHWFLFNNIEKQEQHGPIEDVTIRRTVFANNWNGGGASTGFFARKVKNLVIDECVFDHNGWKGDDRSVPASQGGPYTFSHNIYLLENGYPATVKNSIISRASYNGMKMRSGGTAENNLFIANSAALNFFKVGTVRRNVVMHGVVLSGSKTRDSSRGLHVINPEGVTIENNLTAHIESAGGSGYEVRCVGNNATWSPDHRYRFVMRDNIAYNWKGGIYLAEINNYSQAEIEGRGRAEPDLPEPAAGRVRQPGQVQPRVHEGPRDQPREPLLEHHRPGPDVRRAGLPRVGPRERRPVVRGGDEVR